jgi:WD40 repeat protein
MALVAVFAGLKSQVNSIRSLIESSEGSLASHLPLEARISSIKAANSFDSPFNKLIGMVDGKLEEQLGLNLTHAIYRDQVYNQIETGQRALEAIAMSPSGHLIASTSSKSNEAKLWDIHGKPKGSIKCTQCSRVMFSADGQKLVALNGNNEIVFWDIRSFPTELKNKKFRLTGTSNVNKIAFSVNGKRVVALGNDGVIRIWDLWGDHQNPLQKYQYFACCQTEGRAHGSHFGARSLQRQSPCYVEKMVQLAHNAQAKWT